MNPIVILLVILFTAIVIWNVYVYNHIGKKVLSIFQEVNSESFLFSEKSISGYCESGLVEENFVELGIPKFITDVFLILYQNRKRLPYSWGGGYPQKNLDVYITSKELWISCTLLRAVIMKTSGCIHKAPFSKLRSAEIIENRSFLNDFDTGGKIVKMVIEKNNQKDAVMILKMKKADEFLKIINDKIAEK